MYTCIKHRKITEVKEAWEKIYAENPLLAPYQSYEFCSLVAADYRLSHLRVLLKPVFFEIKRDGETVVIVPLWRKPIKKPPFTEYYLFPDFCLCGYLDVVYRADCTDEDFEAALKLVKERIKGSITFRRVNETSRFGQYLLGHFEPYGDAPSAMVSFPDGYDPYFASLGKQTRQNVRTSRNRLKRDEKSYELKVFSRQPLEDELWDKVLRVHLKRKLIRDNVREGGLRNYVDRKHDPMERALRTLPFNCLFMLEIDGVEAAYLVGFLSNDGKTLVVPRLAIDDDFKFYSPGILLVAETISYLAENTDVRNLDLCHGEQSYKYVMGAHARTNYYFTID